MDSLERDCLIQQLDEAKQQASYWKKIAQNTGRLRLREIENLSGLDSVPQIFEGTSFK